MNIVRVSDIQFELILGAKPLIEVKIYTKEKDFEFDYLTEEEFFELVDKLNVLKQTYLKLKNNVQD